MINRIREVFEVCKNKSNNTIEDLIISTNCLNDRNNYDVYFFSEKKIYYIKNFMEKGISEEYIIDIDDDLKSNKNLVIDEGSSYIKVSMKLGNHLICSYSPFAFNIKDVVEKYLK